MIQFTTDAKASELKPDEDVVDVPIEGFVYKARRPTPSQAAMITGVLRSGGMMDVTVILDILEALLGTTARNHLYKLLMQRKVEIEDLFGGGTELNPGQGLIEQIIEEFTNRPSEPSIDSSASPETDGRRSTGRSPGPGSTLSPSPSTDSSTSSTSGPSSEFL